MKDEIHAGADAAEGDGSMSLSADKSATARHTEGPWTHYDDSGNPQHRHMIGALGKTVAHIYCTNGAEAEDRANAQLIAAAPSYYEGVAEAIKPNDGYNCEYVSIPRKAWLMILAAHAKAEGR